MHRNLTLLALVIAVSGCTRPAPPTPAIAVDPGEVRGIVFAGDDDEQALCEREIEAAGAKVLYRGAGGLLFASKALSELPLVRCAAPTADNEAMPPRVDGDTSPRPDLPTLLRLIPAEEIGARSFIAANPTYDGRNVVVAILDTGVELDHPMLRKTSDGRDKVIAFEDLSGEGRVILTAVTVGTDGAFTAASGSYSAKEVAGTDFHFGVFAGSTLVQAAAVSAQDTFTDVGVLTYKTAEGAWRARVDTNDDKVFSDEVELHDFSVSRAFTKLGRKRSLTVNVNIAANGKVATLCFDDGSHGTHVAGITAGFDPQGLQGVAPGAQVIAAKIGDNRLSGGSTTTASMLLAIDYAVAKGAQVINLSYGIRAGSNAGRSAIDAYIDKVAAEKGVHFSISAGNEGPGLLTVGTPAGANLAITNGAYISKRTARDNYGYLGVEDDNTWFFSSVGPRLDGGWKPTLLAPGTAVSSVPLWNAGSANFRGTSMASPQVTGGLALILSAAAQAGLAVDRASVTRAVYRSATVLPNLSWVEQGNGLMNVNQALGFLQSTKGTTTIEYAISANSVTTPDGKGAGIFVRSRRLPAELFTVGVKPTFPVGTPQAEQQRVRTFRLTATAPWIRIPTGLWMNGTAKTFQVDLDPNVLTQPGLRSEKISAVDEATGLVAFEVPVTVVAPLLLSDETRHEQTISAPVKVGQTLRYFLDVPAGATAVSVELTTDGPAVWGQLLDAEGRLVLKLQDVAAAPQPPLSGNASVRRGGVYELDLVAPPTNRGPARVQVKVRAFGLRTSLAVAAGPNVFEALVQNDFEPLKVTPEVSLEAARRTSVVTVAGSSVRLPFNVSAEDAALYSSIKFTVATAATLYDLLTDYPYRVFDKDGKVVASGGLELRSEIVLSDLSKLTPGAYQLELQGAFTKEAPAQWAVELTEERVLSSPVVLHTGSRVLVETGQTISVPVNLSTINVAPAGFTFCPTVTLLGVQKTVLCP